MRTTAHELRHALRSLARNRRISLLSVALFAVTIGVTTAIYAVVDVMLRPIGMLAPDRTVVIWQRDDTRDTPVVEAAHGEIDTWRGNSRSFEALGAFSSVNWSLSLIGDESRTRLAYAAVSAQFFDVAGIAPALGRVLDNRDEVGSEPRTAVISHQLWRQRFGANPRIIGAVLRLQEDVESPVRSVEVVGVMPPAFDFPRGTQAWIPAAPSLRAFAQRAGQDAGPYLTSLRVFYALGRVRQDATVAQGHRRSRARSAYGARSGSAESHRSCHSGRRTSGSRGFIGAIVIASATTNWLVSTAPLDVPRLDTTHLTNDAVVLLMVGLTTMVAVLASVWPALFVGRIDAGRTLTAGARPVMHPRERRLQRIVVGWQVAVPVVLLAGAALFVRSVQTLDRTDVGFRAEGLLSMEIEPALKEIERRDAFYDGLLSRTGELSGVASAGAVYLDPSHFA
jgi:hypothetical protein